MNNLQYPLEFQFKVTTLSNDFLVRDASGATLSYVRQKLFKFIDEISVYQDESKSGLLYTIKANKWIDFSTTYTFTNAAGAEVGRVARKGWASLWQSRYEVFDEKQAQDLLIQEENPWVKLGDALFSEIPIIGIFTGYVFNPSYLVTRPDGTAVVRLQKQPSILGRRFLVSQLNEFESGEEERIVLSLMMMILLERRRG
ncbi:MAG: hypothetical protein EAZ89_19315 [Bacteroidetes bacterium]|nr:MAG: hypothetical protein EAZ89_19315 [Bacteroidota bacterium]